VPSDAEVEGALTCYRNDALDADGHGRISSRFSAGIIPCNEETESFLPTDFHDSDSSVLR